MEVARDHSQQLQAQVEELQEEMSLQESRSHGNASLLSELESSLEVAELGVSKEEVLKHTMTHEIVLPHKSHVSKHCGYSELEIV